MTVSHRVGARIYVNFTDTLAATMSSAIPEKALLQES
jgi:hypothetical protein